MRVVRSLDQLPHGCDWPVATIGNFDGIHRGHQRLFQALIEKARGPRGTPTVLNFHPHPLQILAPANAPRQIQTLDQKLQTMESLGIELVIVLPFSRELAQMSAHQFAVDILGQQLGLREIFVGPNFAFGNRREGSFRLLREIGESAGFLVGQIPPVRFRGGRISSTAVRQSLFAGQVALARRLLGRPFELEGKIVHGSAIGAGIGFPTANLETPNELIPRKGVYVTYLRTGGRSLQSVTNVGVRPTIGGSGASELTIETHALDFTGDLYGELVTLDFFIRLRAERKFEGKSALMAQIQTDIARARRYFAHLDSAEGRVEFKATHPEDPQDGGQP